MSAPYRVGEHYGIYVYTDTGDRAFDRPVATFHDPDEASAFVDAMNERRVTDR